MSFDAVIPHLLLRLKSRLDQLDKSYSNWIGLHYPLYTSLLHQQRLRILGIMSETYTAITKTKPSETTILNTIQWINNNPFNVLDEHIAVTMFGLLHHGRYVAFIQPMRSLKIRYVLTNPNLIGI